MHPTPRRECLHFRCLCSTTLLESDTIAFLKTVLCFRLTVGVFYARSKCCSSSNVAGAVLERPEFISPVMIPAILVIRHQFLEFSLEPVKRIGVRE